MRKNFFLSKLNGTILFTGIELLRKLAMLIKIDNFFPLISFTCTLPIIHLVLPSQHFFPLANFSIFSLYENDLIHNKLPGPAKVLYTGRS